MTCDCMLSRGARARVRAMPGSGPLVCRRTPGQVASDDARGVIVAEHLQQLRSPVRFERPAGRLRQTQRVGGPRCFADLDHPLCSLVIAADLPEEAAAVTLRARVPAEV